MVDILELQEEFKFAPFNSFNQLKADNYLKSKSVFRRRAYSIGSITNSRLNWKEDTTFLQSEELNRYIGGVIRHFEPLLMESKNYIESIVHRLIKSAKIPQDDYEIGCHQIRISAENDFNGYPAPEGFHRDGFDYIAIHCVSLNNVNGAISLVRPIDDEDHLLEHVLMPGQVMVLDDREVEHYVTPMTPKLPGAAHRDIFVITISHIKE
ncbi:Protein of unknown function DUF2257 [Shewanella baltica OS183]|uniref:2OG-Fe dioxygenase family protein n=1 Tax=Shewanella baltica TaxID=62322 RepID=UPI0001E109BF|nr:2OG-Fe dioxygenase family protein [Shewanella baltica]AEG09409.1 Protein of unknown function DUF2257 [Shewanella baltica BA175]EHQ17075.1 Protein of unknown function DUF2257 [Shewanella baltica OS183]